MDIERFTQGLDALRAGLSQAELDALADAMEIKSYR